MESEPQIKAGSCCGSGGDDDGPSVECASPGDAKDERVIRFDLHTHILPKTWPSLKEKYGYGGFISLEHHKPGKARMMMDDKFFREIDCNCWDPEARMKECNRDGVDVQVLSTVPVMFAYWAKPEDTLDLAMYLNDHLAGVVAEDPKRFVALGTLPMQSPDLAIKELQRCMNDLGMAGIMIGSHVQDWNLDAPELFPIFEEAERLGACIFVHPWDMMGKDRMPKYWLPWLVGMPAETSLAICSLMMGGVFERLPRLRWAFAHGGGSFPATVGRVQQGFDVRPDLCQTQCKVGPREYMANAESGKMAHFWCDSLVHDEAMLRYLVELLGSKRVILGSDYPFPLGEQENTTPGKLIESTFKGEPAMQADLFQNAALEFLGVKREQFL